MRDDAGDSEVEATGVPRPFLIGLTGPIGCGKSTVARMLAEVGGTVVDADVLARRVTELGTATLDRIRQRFGADVMSADGTLDRSALAAIVFATPEALRDLELIVHPEVRRLVEAELEDAGRRRVPFVVVEAIKLVEGGLAERCDEVWLVECAVETQRARLRARGLADADAERRLFAQGDALADRLAVQLEGQVTLRRLSTEGSIDETRELVENVLADALTPLVMPDNERAPER